VRAQLANAMYCDPEGDRQELLFSILSEFVRSGDAERYLRPDGRIGWRASRLMLERLSEEEAEARYEESELDD
jgi:hypothetical protein